jgi:hypothetical protein
MPVGPADGVRADTGLWSVWLGVALVGIAATWALASFVGYAVRGVWVISRYIAPLAPPLLLAAGVLGIWLADSLGEARPRRRLASIPLLAGTLATLGLNAWLFTAQVLPHARNFSRGLHACYLGFGDWLREHTEPGTVVAALDVGAVGFASQRHILDLMGLVSPEVLARGREVGFGEFVASGEWLHARSPSGRRPEFLVDRTEGPPRWAGRTLRGVTFELIDTCRIEGVGLREPQPWTIALYRLKR